MKKSLLAVSALLLSQHAFAAEWIFDGKVDPKFGYDDNELLLQNPKGDFSLKLNPSLSLTRALENAKTQLNVGYRVSRYDRLTQLNRQDPFANFNTSYQTERSLYGLKLDYSKRDARSIAELDTGDFTSNSTVTTKSISPSFNYELSETDKLLTSFNYIKQKNEGNNNYTNSRNQSFNVAWQHSFSERFSGGVSGSYTNYHADTSTANNKYDSYVLSLTSNYGLSEIWQLNGQIGMRFLKSDITPIVGPTESSDSTGTTYSLGATRKGEISELNINVARALIPSSTGQVNEQDSYSILYNRDLSETFSAAITASYRQFKNVDNISSSKTEYTEVSPSLKWKLERNLSLDFLYKYRQYKRSDAYDTHSNGAFVSVNYNWDGFRFSR